jgi:hypothetical protein
MKLQLAVWSGKRRDAGTGVRKIIDYEDDLPSEGEDFMIAELGSSLPVHRVEDGTQEYQYELRFAANPAVVSKLRAAGGWTDITGH